MNPAKYVSADWFLGTLLALSAGTAWYALVSRPSLRPTDPIAAPSDTDEPVRVDYNKLTLEAAERLHGKRVVATFTVGTASYTWGEGAKLITVTGPRAPGSGGHTAILKGNRLSDTDPGMRVTVVGTLRVIQHPTTTHGKTTFGGFTEIRVTEEK